MNYKKTMVLKTKEEVDALLKKCQAIHLTSPKIFEGNFYKIAQVDVKYPSGKTESREYLNKANEVCMIIPVTADGNFVMIIQPITCASEGSLIEFPAGYLEKDETSLESGIRQLKEETGYIASEFIPLGEHYQDPGAIKQPVYVYLALGCKQTRNQSLDEGEYIICVEIPYDLMIELFKNNYFKDANTLAAFTKSILLHSEKLKDYIPEFVTVNNTSYLNL